MDRSLFQTAASQFTDNISDFDDISSVSFTMSNDNLNESLQLVPKSPLGNKGPDSVSTSDDTKVVYHTRFFFDDDPMVIFVVQGVKYHVHRYFFVRDSQYFRDLFLELPVDSRYLELPARIKTADFDAFLSILYPTTFGKFELSTAKEWTSVLQLSSEWGFTSIRAMTVEMLEPRASPIEKIILGNKFGIHHWIEPGYIALCARPNPLTLVEAEQLQMKDVVAITTIRESILRSSEQVDEDIVAGYVSRWIKPQDLLSDDSTVAPVSSGPPAVPLSAWAPVIPADVTGMARDVHKLTEDNFESVSKDIVAWASMRADERRTSGLPADSLSDLVESILHRGTSDPMFIGIGTRLFERLTRGIASRVYEYRKGRCVEFNGPKLVQEYLESAIRLIFGRSTKYNHNHDALNRILYGELSSPEPEIYDIRCHNATVFAAELLERGLVSVHCARKCLESLASNNGMTYSSPAAAWRGSHDILAQVLPVVGRAVDLPVGENKEVTALLDRLKSDFMWEEVPHTIRKIVQDLLRMREMGWVRQIE